MTLRNLLTAMLAVAWVANLFWADHIGGTCASLSPVLVLSPVLAFALPVSIVVRLRSLGAVWWLVAISAASVGGLAVWQAVVSRAADAAGC